MSKHHSMDRRRILKMLRMDGWVQIRQKGGHVQFRHPRKSGKVTVPYHISKNVELSIMHQAGIRIRVGRLTRKEIEARERAQSQRVEG